MPDLSSVYNFYYMFPGDRWYPGFDEENMQIAENQFAAMAKYIGTCVGTGWTVTKLSEERADQLNLLGSYINNPTSEYGQKIINMNLNFPSSNICAAGTTNNINLSGGAPNSLDGVILSNNSKILVKNQTIKSENGVYSVSSLGTGNNGTWVRDSILDSSADFSNNFLVYVSGGTANTSTLWIGASLGSTFGTNDLYFVNTFEQCVKVYPGDGIVDIFYGKTDKPYYFRLINEDDHYIWAEKTLNIEYNNSAKITAPEEPLFRYGATNNATYLATIVSSFGSTLYDLATVNSIVYGPNRKQFLDFAGDYQASLTTNFENHKHLGELKTASKINLQNHISLNAVNTYEDIKRISSSVFILENVDGTFFEENLNNYGTPKVYVDNKLLNNYEFYFDTNSSPTKLILKNSVLTTSQVKVYLPLYIQKELLCIDSNGLKLESSLSTITTDVLLSDGTLEDRTPEDTNENLVYKNFNWSTSDYLDAKVYLNDVLIQPKHYAINPYNASIKFFNTLPNYNSYTYDKVKIKLYFIGSEITNKITFDKLKDLDASTFDKGTLSVTEIEKLNHNFNSRYRENAVYKFDKFLLSGFGTSYYYPENSLSDLQYNTKVNGFFKTANLQNGYLCLTDSGLFNSSSTFTKIKTLDSWNNDEGKAIQIIDDLLIPDGENLLQTTYLNTSDGKIFSSSDNFITWNELGLPYTANSKQITVSSFDLSTSRDEIEVGTYQNSTFIYLATNNGLYGTKIIQGQTQFEWQWTEIPVYSNSNVISLKNFNFVNEIVTKNTEIIAGESDLITYDRHIYVGSSDSSYSGLYFGDTNYVTKVFSENVTGITWIESGLTNINKNNIIWWNDYDAYITHTARYVETSSGNYWEHPFENETTAYSDCVCATTENIVLSGLQTIDGYTVTSGQRVLVKNQTDKTENGIYLANSSSWTRSTDLNSDNEFIYFKTVSVLNGNENANSIWFLKYSDSYELGVSNIGWDIYKKKIYSTSTPSFSAERSIIKNIIVRNSNLNKLEYLVIHNDGVAIITEGDVFVTEDLIYESPLQGKINDAISLISNDANGILYLATENGIYKSTEFLWKNKDTISDINIEINPWNRTENVFNSNDDILLINSKTNSEIISFEKYFQWQLFYINEPIDLGTNILFEKDFRSFYIEPWFYDFLDDNNNPIKYSFTVFINGKPTNIPYKTDSTTGLIQFVSGIQKSFYKKVFVNIFSNNQYLNDVGNLTHEELFATAFSEIPIARLSVINSPDDIKLYLNQDIKNTEQILLLDDGNIQEIVYIDAINNFNTPVEITLISARSNVQSSHTFQAGTTVYSIKDSLTKNIQDGLYNLISKERHTLGSLNNLNTNKLISNIDKNISNVFDILPSAPFAQNDTRGFQNLKYSNDFINDSILDSTVSITTKNIGTPSLFSFENSEIKNIYDIENISKSGLNSIILTDKGIWQYNGYSWKLIYNSEKVVFNNIEEFDGVYKISSSDGIYILNSAHQVNKDDTYLQKTNDYNTGFFENINYEAFAKNDGLLIIKYPENNSFVSEYIDKLDNKEVFSIDKYSGVRSQNLSLVEYDLFIACAIDGVYGISSGITSDIFGNSLISRKLLDLPNGYNIIRSSLSPYQIPTIPANNNLNSKLFLLTNNGLIKVNNFRLCDPSNSIGLNFNIEKEFLTGIDCLSYATDFEEAIDSSNPGKSKIFIGTNRGVYRSLDGGNYFEPTERFENKLPIVNSLKYFTSEFASGTTTVQKKVLIACTNIGLWYSIDDGDNWNKCGNSTADAELPVEFEYYPSNYIKFSSDNTSNYLSQTFRCPASADTIDKVSVLLTVDKNKVNQVEYTNSLNNNYIQVTLCQVDVNDAPDLSSVVASSSTPTVYLKDLIDNNFNYFDFNYSTSSNQKLALVIREIVTTGGISLLNWKKCQSYDSTYFGFAFSRYDGSWTKLDNENNQYNHRIIFSSSLQPTENIVPVGVDNDGNLGWFDGKFKGCIVNDNGELVSDIRFLISLVLDDSKSMGRLKTNFNYISLLNSFLNTLFSRTNRTIDSSPFDFTAIEMWTIDNQLLNNTNFIFSNDKNSLINKIESLRQSGNYTGLLNGLEVASSSLFKNSIQSTLNNYINELVTYLQDDSSLRLSDLIADYNAGDFEDDWDETASDIKNSEIATRILIDKFSNSYVPLLICISDGENVSTNNVADLKFNSINFWDGLGFNYLIFDFGRNEWQDEFFDLVYETNSLHFQIDDSSELQNCFDSLLHGEVNNIFQSYWSRSFIYDEPKYISKVYAEFTVSTSEPINSECVIKFRYSTDHNIFSDWITLTNSTDYILNKKITNIEYEVNMKEGWNGSPVKPSVQLLYHTEVQPSEAYLFTDIFDIDGYLNEYIISTNTNLSNHILNFGASRENSNNWNEFTILKENKNSILLNRQKEYKSNPEKIYSNLSLRPVNDDLFEFEIIKDNAVFKWADDYSEEILLNSSILDSGLYRIDNNSGIIIFDQIQEDFANVVVNITELSTIYLSFGESTTTSDFKTYYSVNGSWKNDDNIVVFVNNEIYRKNYILDKEIGSVTFYRSLLATDVVTIFVQHPTTYRLCAKITSYENSLPSDINFEFQFNTLKNLNKLSELKVISKPFISDNRPKLLSTLKTLSNTLSVNYPIHIDYSFDSDFDTEETESITSWWVQKSTYFSELIEYSNRILQKQDDLKENNSYFEIGDEVNVRVEPKDKYKLGSTFISENYILSNLLKPYVYDVKIKSNLTISNNIVNSNTELTAGYSYVSALNDNSIIEWYSWGQSNNPIHTGTILPSSLVVSGNILSFIITPFDGTTYGDPIESNYILVI